VLAHELPCEPDVTRVPEALEGIACEQGLEATDRAVGQSIGNPS
jgi:hypothetical protein